MDDEVKKEETVDMKTENTEQSKDTPTFSKRALKKLKKRQEWLDTRKGKSLTIQNCNLHTLPIFPSFRTKRERKNQKKSQNGKTEARKPRFACIFSHEKSVEENCRRKDEEPNTIDFRLWARRLHESKRQRKGH